MSARETAADRRDREWWKRLRERAEQARRKGEASFDLGELVTSAEGQMALALVSAVNNFAGRQRRLDSVPHQRFLLSRYCAFKSAGGRAEDRSQQIVDQLDPALVALANTAIGSWQLEELTADLRGSRSVVERRIDEYYALGDSLIRQHGDSLAELQPGPSDGPGIPRRSWMPAPPEDDAPPAPAPQNTPTMEPPKC